MGIRPILRMGHPVLAQVAAPVGDVHAPEIPALVDDMLESMAAVGGLGLAAPQIGESLRLVIFRVPEGRSSGEADDLPLEFQVLINPEIETIDDEKTLNWEGCLSVPGMRGEVPRFARIRYRGLDLDGNPVERTVSGFHARVVQHEVDHLDGILYPQRMVDMSRFGYVEELYEASADAGDEVGTGGGEDG